MFLGLDVRDHGLYLDVRVDLAKSPARGLGLGQRRSGVVLVEEQLPLQVRQLDEVAVDDP